MLLGTVERIAAQRSDTLDIQILVCDNGSGDSVVEELRRAAPVHRFQLESETTPGKNRALKRLIPLVDSDLVVFTDDDIIPAEGWLDALVGAAERWPEVGIFGGRTTLAAPPGADTDIFEIPDEPGVNFARYAPLVEEAETRDPPHGPNFMVRRGTLERFALDETIGPDGSRTYTMGSETELLLRMLEGGARLVYVPSAHVRHIVRPDQLERPQLYARSYRVGLTWSRLIDPSPADALMFSAPRWRWRELARALSAHVGARARHTSVSIASGLHLHRVRGVLHEYRRARRDERTADS